jgi:hypothetical protein
VVVVLIAILIVSDVSTNFRWRKSLENREKAMQKAEKTLAKILAAQYEQAKATQHLLNGQKLRYLVMNEQAKDIEKVLEEVKDIESGFKRYSKRRKRR